MLSLLDKSFRFLFLFILFVVFYSPINSAHHVSLPGVKLAYSEIAFLLLPMVNLLIDRNKTQRINFKNVKELSIAFIAYIFIIEFVKEVMIAGSIGDYVKSIRLALPLLSVLFMFLITGLRVDIKILWKVLLVAVLISNVLAILGFIFNIARFQPMDIDYLYRGRLYNSNASFGVIGLFLLFESRKKWYNEGWLPLVTSLFSLTGLILTGNRTYLIVMTLMVIILVVKRFSTTNVVRGTVILSIAIFAAFQIYSGNDYIKRQVDKRITPLIRGSTAIVEDAYYGGREIIFQGVIDKIEDNHWIIGLPYEEPIFDYGLEIYKRSGRGKLKMTDTSFVNLLLRYGILSLVLFLLLLYWLYKGNLYSNHPSRIFLWVMPMYLLASVNIDSLVSHNSIFFVMISLFVYENLKRPGSITRNGSLIGQN